MVAISLHLLVMVLALITVKIGLWLSWNLVLLLLVIHYESWIYQWLWIDKVIVLLRTPLLMDNLG